MKSFRRVFEYVWPQWPRLVLIAISALLVGVLFSVSIGTILPLLKVMMGEEGLHGWVDRIISQDRYGVNFYLPDSIDLSDPENVSAVYQLRITSVEEDSPAEKAGLQKGDMIVGAGSALVKEASDKIPSRTLLQELAQTPPNSRVLVQFRRIADGKLVRQQTELPPGESPFFAAPAQKLLSYIPSDNSREHRKEAVVYIIVALAFVTALRCIARFYQDYTVGRVQFVALARLRERAFGHAMHIPVGYFGLKGSSDITSRLVRDVGSIGNGIKVLLGKALREPLKAAGLIVTAMILDLNLTLIFLCSAPLALYAINKLGRKIKRATRKSLESWSAMLGKLGEALASVKVVKVYNRQDHEHKVFSSINHKLLRQQFRIAKVDASTGPILESLGMVAGSVALLFGAQWVFDQDMDPSTFLTLIACLGTAAETIRKTSSVWNKLQQSNAAATRVYAVVDEPLEHEVQNAAHIPTVRESIEFQDIRFAYPGTETAVLKDINLTVSVGSNVAIVGPNGSGKTTLLNLLPRFYDPDHGRVLIDGIDIAHASLSSLRGHIGLVTQNVVTFHDTIAANIAYGRPGAEKNEIVDAARRAFADEFVRLLPRGYDTVIGEHGAGLSGGQLQRIVIARAILKNPAILIFDEATSQVDADSEAKIHQAIEELMRGRTSFIIAHRLSTIVKADIIVVMDNGRIIARGRHDELLTRCGLYRSLYETQMVKA